SLTLDDPLASSQPDHGTNATGINDTAEIVGYYIDDNGLTHGFLATTQQLSGQVVLTSVAEGVATLGTIATFTDTNTNDTAAGFTAIIDWGDGTTETGTIIGLNGSFSVAVPGSTHFYADEGSNQALVTITRTTDGDQITPTGTISVTEGDV